MSQPERHTDLSALLRAASEGDQEAWNAITDRFTNLLWSVARSYRLNHDDAADAVQNTWLRLLENLTKIDNPEALPGWLATTARREALGVLRRRGRTCYPRRGLGVDPSTRPRPSWTRPCWRTSAMSSCGRRSRAPERCQQLLRVLMACDRPVYAEVAAAFDMPIGSIGPTRMRCLERLRRVVAESGYQFDGPMDRPREARS